MRRTSWIMTAVAVTGLWGCAATTQLYSFPSVWPDGLTQPQADRKSTASLTPAVWVASLEWTQPDSDQQQTVSAGQTSTKQVLDRWFMETLASEGIRLEKSKGRAEYELSCEVDGMQYATRSGFPKRIIYTAGLGCALIHRGTGVRVWERDLKEEFENIVVVDAMSRHPQAAFQHEQVLVEECLTPMWRAVSTDLHDLLKDNAAGLRASPEASASL